MDETFKDPVHFSKGINMKDLMSSSAEFHLDIEFGKSKDMFFNGDQDMYPDMDDEDDSDEDVLKNIEDSVERSLLSSPQYLCFKSLGATMVDCLSNGDVKILILEEGDGPLVPYDAEVKIHYAAYWEGAQIPFDSTLTMNGGAPTTIRLGKGRFLPGLEVGLSHVKGPTARFHLLLQPTAAWGPRGIPPRIRPEPALFVITLYDVRDVQAAARFHDLPSSEQSRFEVTIQTVKDLRADAKTLFAKHKYKRAINNYQQAMSVLSVSRPETDDQISQIKELKIKIYVNLAVCYYKLEKPKYVINMCKNIDRIIDIGTHCKAAFYYGRAYEMIGKIDEAILYYKKALKLEPKNKEIGNLLAQLDAKTKKSAVDEQVMWQKAFNASPLEKKKVYDVDEDFQNGVLDMCQELAGSEEYAKIDLPVGLTTTEVDCIKSLASQFQGLVVQEDGKKKISLIKNV